MVSAWVAEQAVSDQFFRKMIAPPKGHVGSLPDGINGAAAAPQLEKQQNFVLSGHRITGLTLICCNVSKMHGEKP
jgi:hypothetical protein